MTLRRTAPGGSPGSRPAPVDPDDGDAADAVAGRMLAAGERSRTEVRRRLTQRGFSVATAAAAVERLAARGWVDDRRLAESLARRGRDRGYGRRRVAAELRARGAEEAAVSEVLEVMSAGESAAALAAALRWRRVHPPSPDPARDMLLLVSALRRRGFGSAEIRAAVGRLPAATALADG